MTPEVYIVSSIQNVKLDIYVVGYTKQGESVLCVLRDQDRILFVSIVDTYAPSKRPNYITKILDILGRPQIDMLVWTHPDIDHTRGLSKLMEVYDPGHKADIFIPSHLSEIANRVAKKEFGILQNWYNPSKSGTELRRNITEISTFFNEERTYREIILTDESAGTRVHFKISFFLPNSSRTIRKASNWKMVQTNEHSIVHSIVFNNQNFLFCGDLTKNNVKLLPELFYNNVRFIKIPHHGSTEPINFAGKLYNKGTNRSISATTVFRVGRNDDPDEKTINLYKLFCSNVFSTGKECKDYYGCIKLTMSSKGDLESQQLMGNAVCL